MFERIAIFGPGLLGASLGLAVKERGVARRAAVWARRSEVREACRRRSWCDEVFANPEDAAADAGLGIICTPVEAIRPLAIRVAAALPEGAVLTDVGSTKSLICRQTQAAMLGGAFFVGSHPMAGSEKSGMEHARADLFLDRPCFVTPLADTPDDAVDAVTAFWMRLGMEVRTISPEKHDEIVAHISHLPHVLAVLECTLLAGRDEMWRNCAGPGLRDATRIASGDPSLWKSILKENHEEILRAVKAYENELARFRSALANRQFLEVLNYLERGKACRDRFRPENPG